MGIFQSKHIEPKVVLITGASAGIGKDTALTMIQRGHIVYGAARRIDNMQDIVKAGGHAIQMDITQEAQVKQCVKRIMEEQSRIDVLINNAGYTVYGSVEDVSMEDAKRQFEVNLFGLAALTKAVIPSMRKERKGTIINVSSIAGKIYSPYASWYYASKHALEGWSDCLRLELSQFNIKVAIVEPGAIRTEVLDVMADPLVERSKGGHYEEQIDKFLKGAKEFTATASPTSVITNLLVKASESKSPKRRYVAGKGAAPMLFIRSWLGDGVFDFIMKSLSM